MKRKTILLVEDNANDEFLTLRAFKEYNIANDVVDFPAFVEAVGQLGLYWLMLNEAPPKT
jgi:hypothetical protein